MLVATLVQYPGCTRPSSTRPTWGFVPGGRSAGVVCRRRPRAVFGDRVKLRRGGTSEEVGFQLQGESVEEFLHDWLAELLYTFHVRRMVLREFDVRSAPADLSATARGEPIDLGRHEIDVEVKAITWHGFKVEKTPERLAGRSDCRYLRTISP